MAALTDPRADEQAYREHERSVLAMLSTRYRDLDPDGRRELYHEAWASVLRSARWHLIRRCDDRDQADQEQLGPVGRRSKRVALDT
ncbi:MAG TPA: hypothetical protein VEX39_04015 [Thermoleophilaceae bacterium]|nr:hypothetical protein [Thermoleophilaceae bacterium]